MTDAQVQLLVELCELAEDFNYPRREEFYERAALVWAELVGGSS